MVSLAGSHRLPKKAKRKRKVARSPVIDGAATFDHNDRHMTSEIFTFPLRECSSSEWYNSPKDHRCPHDAWVESITISELSSGKRHQVRDLEIRVRLLGAYHDGSIEFTYKRVLRYLIGAIAEWPAGHGDWLEDDVDVKQDASLMHRVKLKNGSLKIQAEDIEYKWIPLPSPSGT